MRIGQNPAKSVKDVALPQRITVAVLNYIPFLSGYYAEMLDVLQACLDSILASSDLPFDLLLFDNGSCDEVRQFLVQQYREQRLQYLFLSHKNLGKGGAWNIILSGAPGEIIAYTDNDCYFYPGWLSQSVKLLETFPRVGMVTARPFRTNEQLYSSTVQWAQQTPGVIMEKGSFISWEVFREFDMSLGQSEEEVRQRYACISDARLTYEGITSFAGASHWQFLAYKSVLQQFLPFTMERPMGQVKQLDQRVNEAGLLRLMTTEPLAMNMSNSLGNLSNLPSKSKARSKTTGLRKVLDFPPLRFLLLRYYDQIFRWYYDR